MRDLFCCKMTFIVIITQLRFFNSVVSIDDGAVWTSTSCVFKSY